MTDTRATIRAAAMLFAVGLLGGGAMAQQAPAATADDYASGNYGRVREAASGLSLVRAQWNQQQGVADQAGVNSPIFPGDRVTTTEDQRAEIELARGTLVRIDRSTEVSFLALPDPYAEVADHSVLQLAGGRMRLSAALRDGEELRIDTPAASVYPLGDADLRVEVIGGGRTRVYSRSGVVEVVGGGGSVLVRGGMRTDVEAGQLPFDPEPFNTFVGDDFDHYVEQRDAAVIYTDYAGSVDAYDELPETVQPYYRELSANGSWIETEEAGYVWQPANVEPDWRPYLQGSWAYGPSGYFWVSNEPWGWAPYHYGRWSWIGGYGWCWSPGYAFSGSWVSWSWGSVYVGWAPLDYWGYPAYHSHAYYGYYDPHCWTFVSYHHLGHHDYYHYSAPWDHVYDHVEHNAVVTRPPRESPDRLAASPDARSRAYDDARSRSHEAPPRADSQRSRDGSFRDDERGAQRRGGDGQARLRTDAPSPPEGRVRTAPLSRRPSNRRAIEMRDTERGRDRLPVVSTPRGTGSARTADPGKRTGTKSVGTPRSTVRPDSSGRVRDIYRKMSKPRSTRETPSASKSTGRSSAPSRARPTQKTTSGTRPKSKPPESRSRPKSKPPESRASTARSAPAPQRKAPSTSRSTPRTSSPRQMSRPSSGSRAGGSKSSASPGRSSSGSRSGGGSRKGSRR